MVYLLTLTAHRSRRRSPCMFVPARPILRPVDRAGHFAQALLPLLSVLRPSTLFQLHVGIGLLTKQTFLMIINTILSIKATHLYPRESEIQVLE